jgi:hypothetical protein
MGVARTLDNSCRQQVQDWYKQQGYSNWRDQGCITEPVNVIALPITPGQPNSYEVINKNIKFGVAEKTVSSISEQSVNQKNLSGFTGFGYSVFVQPQY